MKAKLATCTLIGLVACSLGRAQTPAAAEPAATASQTAAVASPASDSTAAPATAEPAATAPASTTVAAAEPSGTAATAADTATSAPSAAAPADTTAQPTTAASSASDSTAAATATAEPAATTTSDTTTVAANEPSTNAPSTTEPASNAPSATEPAGSTPAAEEPAATASAGDTSSMSPGATNIIPLIQFQDVSLTTAIENLARQAGLNYILDPKVTFGQPGPNGQPAPQPNINLRWENLTAGQALTALLTTYSLQLVEDPNTGVARITVKDPAAPEPLLTKIIQLKYAAPSNVLSSVQSTFTDKRSKVVADVRTSQLVVVATDKEQRAVQELIDRLDTPDKQVLIEAKILETTVNPKTIKGIDWSGTLAAQHIAFGNNVDGGQGGRYSVNAVGTVDPVLGNVVTTTYGPNGLLNSPGLLLDTAKGFNPATAFLDADGLNAVLSFLNSSSDTKVVSEPRVVTLDNQKATIDVGIMFPIVNVTAGTANTTGGSMISYSNLTVNLDVTPRITADNTVELKVQQHILRLGPSVTSKVNGQDNDVNSFFTRSMETAVLIPQGNTLVMGGLISDEQTSGNKKVPVLGDIPVLGYLFRQDSKERNKQNLLVFLTPSVVGTNDFQPAHSTFLKTDMNNDKANAVKEDWSWWDSGKPASSDWSKPKEEPVYQ